MATEVIKTIKATGGDYTSLAAWEAGENRDLVTADEIAVAEIYNDILVNRVDFRVGWTTSATNRIVLRCPTVGGDYDQSYYHAGVVGEGVKLDTDNGDYSIIPYANMTIAGLEITQSNASASFIAGGTPGRTIRSLDLLIHDFISYTTFNEYAENCVFYGGSISANSSRAYLHNGIARNCSAYADNSGGVNGEIVFYSVECYACVIYNTTVGGYNTFYTCSGDYNACNDTSAPGDNSLDNISDPFVDAANGDLSITADSVLKDAGPATPYTTGDITGTARPQGDYSDIGAWEYAAGGSTIINLTGGVSSLTGAEGAPSKNAAVAGAVLAVSAGAGSISAQKNLLGGISAGASAAAGASVKKLLLGATDATTAVAGQMSVLRVLSGGVSAATGVQGEILLQGVIKLSGSIATGADSAGLISVGKQLSGVIPAAATVDGQVTITLTGETLYLTGGVSAQSALSGGVSTRRGLSGAVDTITSADGSVSAKLNLSGGPDAIAEIIGELSLLTDGGLGVVIDTSVESATVSRLIESITTKYTIHST